MKTNEVEVVQRPAARSSYGVLTDKIIGTVTAISIPLNGRSVARMQAAIRAALRTRDLLLRYRKSGGDCIIAWAVKREGRDV